MKPRVNSSLKPKPTVPFRTCRNRYHNLESRVADTRRTIAEEFRDTFQENQHLARLALNEAEAIAWQTNWPHLIFPELAQEKVRALALWSRRQRSLRYRPASGGPAVGKSHAEEFVTTE